MRLTWMMTVMMTVMLSVGGARVRLNSIRTEILTDGHALRVNRSAWGPGVELTLYRCMSDLECSEGSYCHVPTGGPAHSRCHACRRRNRRCQRDSMCCPGNRCNINICVPDVDGFLSQGVLDADGDMAPPPKGWRRRGRVPVKGSSGKGREGDPCLRSSDCAGASCCARHFWTRICKPVLREGQVCTRQRRKGQQGLELFQRCGCGEGLACRAAARDADGRTPPPPPPSSSLLDQAAKAKFAASPSSPRHASPLSSPGKPSAAVTKTRLHVCRSK